MIGLFNFSEIPEYLELDDGEYLTTITTIIPPPAEIAETAETAEYVDIDGLELESEYLAPTTRTVPLHPPPHLPAPEGMYACMYICEQEINDQLLHRQFFRCVINCLMEIEIIT